MFSPHGVDMFELISPTVSSALILNLPSAGGDHDQASFGNSESFLWDAVNSLKILLLASIVVICLVSNICTFLLRKKLIVCSVAPPTLDTPLLVPSQRAITVR